MAIEHNECNNRESNQILLNEEDRQVLILSSALGMKSAIYHCLIFLWHFKLQHHVKARMVVSCGISCMFVAYYWQHCMQRKAKTFKLLEGWLSGNPSSLWKWLFNESGGNMQCFFHRRKWRNVFEFSLTRVKLKRESKRQVRRNKNQWYFSPDEIIWCKLWHIMLTSVWQILRIFKLVLFMFLLSLSLTLSPPYTVLHSCETTRSLHLS